MTGDKRGGAPDLDLLYAVLIEPQRFKVGAARQPFNLHDTLLYQSDAGKLREQVKAKHLHCRAIIMPQDDRFQRRKAPAVQTMEADNGNRPAEN